jgi:hypothetical protein
MRTENHMETFTPYDAATDHSLATLQIQYAAAPDGQRRVMCWTVSPAVNAHHAAARVDAFFASMNDATHAVTIRQSAGVFSICAIFTH